MSHDAHDDHGHLPDVAQGRDLVYITRWGSWEPLFRMTPYEAVMFAGRVSRAARRIEEEQRAGSVTPAERDDHLHLVEVGDSFDTFTHARPPHQPGWWERDLAVFVAGLGIAVIVWWLWTVIA
jgi:hypothetical protein